MNPADTDPASPDADTSPCAPRDCNGGAAALLLLVTLVRTRTRA